MFRSPTLRAVAVATLAACLFVGCGSDSETESPATTVSASDEFASLAIRAADLPDEWTESSVDLAEQTPLEGPVCLIDPVDPSTVAAAAVMGVVPDATYDRKVATTSARFVSEDLAADFDERVSSGAAGECLEAQFSASFGAPATTTTTPLPTDLDSSYLLHTVASVPATGTGAAIEVDQEVAVLRKGDVVVILEQNSEVGPFPQELHDDLITKTVDRLAAM